MGLLTETCGLENGARNGGVEPSGLRPPMKKTLHERNHHKSGVFVTLGSVAHTAGPWQEVDRRVKYGWRLALPPVPRVWTETERLFIAQRPGGGHRVCGVRSGGWRQTRVCCPRLTLTCPSSLEVRLAGSPDVSFSAKTAS